MKIKYVGVDGCKAGWFGIEIQSQEEWAFEVYKPFKDVWTRWSTASSILVDIPIGLPHQKPKRSCDVEARAILGPRRNSVFPVPARATLRAASYKEAQILNRNSIGKGLSKQSYGIFRKIKEVDDILQTEHSTRNKIREIHPEVLFWALNNFQPMQFRKQDFEGKKERLATLQEYFPAAENLLEQAMKRFFRKDVAADDILDALAAAVTAWRAQGNYRTLPEKLDTDSTGLKMEMVY